MTLTKLVEGNFHYILGTVQLGLPYGINNGIRPSFEDSLAILSKAFELGIRYLDTAESYGTSLEVIAAYQRKSSDKKFKIYSKFSKKNHLFEIQNEYNRQINLLNILPENFQGFYFHHFTDYKIFKKDPQFSNDIKLGVSIYSLSEFREVLTDENITVIQIPLNIFSHNTELSNYLLKNYNEIKKLNKVIVARSVYLQGFLFVDNSKVSSSFDELINLRLYFEKKIKSIGISKIEFAQRYLMDLYPINGLIFGAENINQLESNIIINSNLEYKNNIEVDWFSLLDDCPKILKVEMLNPGNWSKV